MKRCLTIPIIVLFLLALSSVVHADEGHSKFTKHFQKSLFKITQKGLFSVEMIVKEGELKVGKNEIDLIIHDSNDRDVVDAKVEVIPWMPEMGHGVPEKPVIEEKGGGLYRVKNIVLIMGGNWELRVRIKKDDQEDMAGFNFPNIIGGQMHRHQMKLTPKPSEIDLSTVHLSSRKIYRVSYESSPSPIKLNKFHTWKIKIETSDGKPVLGAKITVSGDMPEHGHGLPTEPAMTKELGNGYYLIEGIKFNMPGWWIVNIDIKTSSGRDTVTFNLYLK